ncbi:DUF6168 family protein [Abyssalbus ytuae]|uniref:DUF6168 family protein n=1 Tax=Abyssalbus ytuae TaxID=2926907 RepID=A0A9E6ZKR2_9FLAO|nr:DUF6168 family protein [Abyssalbus ytuae]UOB16010.1 DUF6168 family protein [Abyssalbus ytuae]
MKKQFVLRFLAILLLSLVVTFTAHILILHFKNLDLFANKIILSYVVNFLVASGIFFVLYGLRNTFKNQIGFLFIAGSFLKFLIFFVIFYPYYKQDGEIILAEFMAFFIPYIICLIIETSGVAKLLKNI